MQIFANSKGRFYSFVDFYVIHLKNKGIEFGSQYHLNFAVSMLLYVQQPDRFFKILLCLAVKISFFTNLLNKSLFIWLNTNFGDHQSKRLNSNLVQSKKHSGLRCFTVYKKSHCQTRSILKKMSGCSTCSHSRNVKAVRTNCRPDTKCRKC